MDGFTINSLLAQNTAHTMKVKYHKEYLYFILGFAGFMMIFLAISFSVSLKEIIEKNKRFTSVCFTGGLL